MTLIRPPLPSIARGKYYPQQKDRRLNEDLRIAYDHIYGMQDQLSQMGSRLEDAHVKLADAHSKLNGMAAKPDPGGPSSTKIAGLNVKGVQPTNGNQVTNLSGKPVLAYNVESGQIEWYIPA